MALNFKSAFKKVTDVGKSVVKGGLGLGSEGGKIEIGLASVGKDSTTPPSPITAGMDISQYYPVIGIAGAGLLFYLLMRK